MNYGRLVALFAAAGLGALILCGSVQAHAQLLLSTPAADSTLDVSPKLIQLMLSEPLDLRFSGLELTDRDARKIETAPVASANPQALTVALKTPLLPGLYRVTWHAVCSGDGHRTQGVFAFKVN